MRTTIGFIDTTADRTSPGGVARVNKDQRHAGKGGLVFDKGSQLIERPTVQLASLRLANPYPVAYPAQVFQSEAAAGVFGLVHELFGDAMVHFGCKAALPARQGFETTPGRVCAFGLEPRPYPVVPCDECGRVHTQHRRCERRPTPVGKRRFSFWVDAADIERLREIADNHPGGRTAWLLEVAVSNLETTAD